jgi:hypothetical protein
MAGTVTAKFSNPFATDGENIVTVDWLTTAGGASSGALCSLFSAGGLAKGYPGAIQPTKFKGFIRKIETIPGLSGDLATTLPTDAYDITLTDAYGADVAGGALANRSGAVAEQVVPSASVAVDSELTINVSAAGATTTGRLILTLSGQREGSSGPYADA